MIITANPQTVRPAVDLLVGSIPAGTATVRIWRSFPGERSPLRDADGAPTGGAGTRPYTDFEIPIGVPTSYTAYAYSAIGAVLGSAQTGPVTADWSTPWISDPLAPSTACPVSLINESLQEISHDVQGDITTIGDSSLSLAVMGAVGEASAIPLRFSAPNAEQGAKIRAVLRSGPFLLRLPPGVEYEIPTLAYIAFTKYTDVKVGRSGSRYQIVLEGAVAVARQLMPTVLALRTLGDVRDEASTLGDVAAQHATLLGVLRGDPS